MIASNYRRFPEAMALQLVLVFGRCTWHTERPTTRQGRAMRAERSRLVKQTPQVVRWLAKAVPAWWREAKRAAKDLAKQVKAAMRQLDWETPVTAEDVLEGLWETAYREHGHKWEASQLTRTAILKRQLWEHYGTGNSVEVAERVSAYGG